LAGEHQPKLFWLSTNKSQPLFSRIVAAGRPCFEAQLLGSDSREKVLLAGKDGDQFGGGAYVVVFDADGNWLGDLPLDSQDVPPTGITATRTNLFVTGPRGLLRFDIAEVVPEGAGQVRCTLVTPVLFSPDREDQRRWLRVEATAVLPEGSRLEISYGTTDDTVERNRLNSISTNDSISASQRVERLLNQTDLWRTQTVFHGSGEGTRG